MKKILFSIALLTTGICMGSETASAGDTWDLVRECQISRGTAFPKGTSMGLHSSDGLKLDEKEIPLIAALMVKNEGSIVCKVSEPLTPAPAEAAESKKPAAKDIVVELPAASDPQQAKTMDKPAEKPDTSKTYSWREMESELIDTLFMFQ